MFFDRSQIQGLDLALENTVLFVNPEAVLTGNQVFEMKESLARR